MQIREGMFEMSKPNLRVNGHNYENFVNATEPFDEILDRRIKGMDAERLKSETETAERRKKRPAEIYQLEDDLEERKTWAMWLPEGEDEDTGPKKKAEDIPPPPRHAEVVETFKTLASNLAELASSAPAQLARAQRAKAVQEEINNMGP
ncbi:hypothetical protein JCM24511_06505 [Saitozyma sp. JCM 24511]|nr:hypothetical protein JCM24511_06505 [Saitozyma sp. JCM 24511]